MTNDKHPLSVAELVELPDDSWVNDGFTAVVRSTERKVAKKTQKPFWVCQLADTTGSATVELAIFTAPKFTEGQQVTFQGQGIKFKNGQYGAKVSVGDKTEIHVIGKSVHHEEQVQRAATGQPSVNGTPQPIHGQTVGMALKEAIALAGMATTDGITRAVLNDPLFWQDVKTYAGNIIRISRSLEAGKLSPASWPTPQKPANEPQRAGKGAPTNEREAANLAPIGVGGGDEDIPF